MGNLDTVSWGTTKGRHGQPGHCQLGYYEGATWATWTLSRYYEGATWATWTLSVRVLRRGDMGNLDTVRVLRRGDMGNLATVKVLRRGDMGNLDTVS